MNIIRPVDHENKDLMIQSDLTLQFFLSEKARIWKKYEKIKEKRIDRLEEYAKGIHMLPKE